MGGEGEFFSFVYSRSSDWQTVLKWHYLLLAGMLGRGSLPASLVGIATVERVLAESIKI